MWQKKFVIFPPIFLSFLNGLQLETGMTCRNYNELIIKTKSYLGQRKSYKTNQSYTSSIKRPGTCIVRGIPRIKLNIESDIMTSVFLRVRCWGKQSIRAALRAWICTNCRDTYKADSSSQFKNFLNIFVPVYNIFYYSSHFFTLKTRKHQIMI